VLAEAIAPSEVTYENYLTILTVEYYFDEIGTCCYDLHSLAHYSLFYRRSPAHRFVSLPATYTSIATTFILFPIIRYVVAAPLFPTEPTSFH
jgi:hypothetical protein